MFVRFGMFRSVLVCLGMVWYVLVRAAAWWCVVVRLFMVDGCCACAYGRGSGLL